MTANKDSAPAGTKDYSKKRATVIRYFINLFRRQLNASSDAPFEVKRFPDSALGKKFATFELRVEHDGDWVSRRMTIAPLGEESGSKSICFYVIYDDHLVVKIPPTPIRDLDQYLGSIYADQRVVFRMEPKECVVPGISVILKRIHSFSADSANPEKMEGKYISWLKKNPAYQEYLKIDDSFVFFMDLSRFRILGDVLHQLHFDIKGRFVEEITKNRGIITAYHSFEGRYGQSRAGLGYDLKHMYSGFEAAVQDILSRYKIPPSTLQYKIEDWFLQNLSGGKAEVTEKEVTPEIIAEVNGVFETLRGENQQVVADYHATVREYLHKKYFAKSKSQMEGLITNILNLLAWLFEKGVAMRDFKPDNILVTGDPEKNPNFLSDPDQYHLGLIDVETAVIYKIQGDGRIEQPQLGGTPFFATPSQLFPNTVLQDVYGNLETILYLQDWYATVGMIYFVVTGKRLFEKTAVKLPAIIRRIEKARQEKRSTADVLRKANGVFWQSAAAEFQEKIKAKERLLKTIQAVVPDPAHDMFLQNLRERRLLLLGRVREAVEGEGVFPSAEEREQLAKASAGQIAELRQNIDGEAASQERRKAACLLLESAKRELEKLDETMRYLVKMGGGTTTYQLLQMMFAVVYSQMQIRPRN